MRSKLLIAALAVMAFMLFSSAIAWAAAPANDDFASATTVTEPLPFNDSVDTVEATSDAADPDPSCALGGTGQTVWYSYTPSSDLDVQAITFDSTYSNVLSVWTGTEGSLTEVACRRDSSVSFSARSRETYYIMAAPSFSDTPGGTLRFKVQEQGRIDSLSIAPVGKVKPKTGVATINGIVVCSGEPGLVEMDVHVSQRIGRKLVQGGPGDFILIEDCSGAVAWSVTIEPLNGLFVAGRAHVDALARRGPEEQSQQVFAEATVRLRG